MAPNTYVSIVHTEQKGSGTTTRRGKSGAKKEGAAALKMRKYRCKILRLKAERRKYHRHADRIYLAIASTTQGEEDVGTSSMVEKTLNNDSECDTLNVSSLLNF